MNRNLLIHIIACIFLAFFFFLGRFGLSSDEYRTFFRDWIAAFNVLMIIIVFSLHQGWNKTFFLKCIFIVIIALAVEVAGVHSGHPFGEYRYGNVLGTQLLNVPLLVGLNWLLLLYCVGNFLLFFKWSGSVALTGAILMIMLDFFLEPFAVQFGLWNWTQPAVPLQNYISWFLISFLLFFILKPSSQQKVNYTAAFTAVIQVLFFISFLV